MHMVLFCFVLWCWYHHLLADSCYVFTIYPLKYKHDLILLCFVSWQIHVMCLQYIHWNINMILFCFVLSLGRFMLCVYNISIEVYTWSYSALFCLLADSCYVFTIYPLKYKHDLILLCFVSWQIHVMCLQYIHWSINIILFCFVLSLGRFMLCVYNISIEV